MTQNQVLELLVLLQSAYPAQQRRFAVTLQCAKEAGRSPDGQARELVQEVLEWMEESD